MQTTTTTRPSTTILREFLVLCDDDDFDAHVADTDLDGAPIFGACSETCRVFPTA